MKKIIRQISKYVIEDTENGLVVNIEIDYISKSFKINSMRKDSSFLFHGINPERVKLLADLINHAAHFAGIELGEVPSIEISNDEIK